MMHHMPWGVLWILISGMFVVCSLHPAGAQTSEESFSYGHLMLVSLNDGASQTHVSIPSIDLLDHHGQKRNIAQLVEGRTVVIDFIFTSCKTSCSILSAIMARVEKKLLEHLGERMLLISLSVDPSHDTPARLDAFSEKMGAGDQWLWLTGQVSEVKQVLKAFGIPVDGRPEDHPPIIMAGNPTTGEWRRWVGIPDPHAVADTAIALSSHK